MNFNENKIVFWRSDYYNAAPVGGLFTSQYGIIRGFKRLGYDNTFITSGPVLAPDGTKEILIPHSNILKNLPEIPMMDYNSKVIKKIPAILNEEKPTFVYHFHAFFNYSLVELKKKYKRPFFLQAEGVLQWVKENWGKTYFPELLAKMEKSVWNHADGIFCVSETVRRQLIDYGAQEDKIHILTCKADTDFFTPDIDDKVFKKQIKPNDEIIIGFLGTFGKWHGIEFLAENVKAITERIPNSKFLFIGDGELRGKVENILENHGIRDKVFITGLVNYYEVPKYLSTCDILVSPCIPNEKGEFINSPVKLFEYMSMGKPLVASDIGQQSEIVKDGVNGIICKTSDSRDFVNKVVDLLENKELQIRISKQARQDAINHYDWINNSKIVLSVFEDIKNNY